ncbi:hypothetical protein [Thermocoleostomius sinensis]|uniref:Uncharacterized protein n=1 Tax=Thermocoleostomius sinensis A174 TaxID=2016057 RepID=A0A9E8ZFB4_9CYAN|nr:hypothetical protein [Thermocoleostomius sinensis]WAL62320.1 hypothetical protein OXH18_10115 [Thermocoleostomius sinensis A174]
MDKPLDESRSKDIAKQVSSKAQSPFVNAYKAALVLEKAMYVQGFLVIAGRSYQPIEHSWLETEEYLIDPTLPHLHSAVENLYYFPAQRLTVKQLKAAIEEAEEDYPDDDPLPIYGSAPYDYYGDVMLGGKEYSQALQAAAAKCKDLNQHLAERN